MTPTISTGRPLFFTTEDTENTENPENPEPLTSPAVQNKDKTTEDTENTENHPPSVLSVSSVVNPQQEPRDAQ